MDAPEPTDDGFELFPVTDDEEFLYLKFRELRANQPQAMDAAARTILTVVGLLTAFYAAGLAPDKLRAQSECLRLVALIPIGLWGVAIVLLLLALLPRPLPVPKPIPCPERRAGVISGGSAVPVPDSTTPSCTSGARKVIHAASLSESRGS